MVAAPATNLGVRKRLRPFTRMDDRAGFVVDLLVQAFLTTSFDESTARAPDFRRFWQLYSQTCRKMSRVKSRTCVSGSRRLHSLSTGGLRHDAERNQRSGTDPPQYSVGQNSLSKQTWKRSHSFDKSFINKRVASHGEGIGVVGHPTPKPKGAPEKPAPHKVRADRREPPSISSSGNRQRCPRATRKPEGRLLCCSPD